MSEDKKQNSEVEVNIVPSKIGRQPIVTTVGFKELSLPEIFYNIPVNKDPSYDYSEDIRNRGILLSEFAKEVIEDASIINLGIIAPHGQVVGFNHKKENERLYFVTPLNVDPNPDSDKPIHERVMLSIILITREALKTLDSNIEVFMFE